MEDFHAFQRRIDVNQCAPHSYWLHSYIIKGLHRPYETVKLAQTIPPMISWHLTGHLHWPVSAPGRLDPATSERTWQVRTSYLWMKRCDCAAKGFSHRNVQGTICNHGCLTSFHCYPFFLNMFAYLSFKFLDSVSKKMFRSSHFLKKYEGMI